MRILSIVTLVILQTSICFSASFNCNKAGTPTEKAICADAQLSKIDEEMAELYKKGLEILDNDLFKKDQKSWIKDRDKCSGNMQCLKFAYQNRIREINDELQTAYGSVKADDYAEAEAEENISPETLIQKPVENSYGNADERKILENVKGSYFTGYPNITIGQAFERFDNPSWKISRTPDNGYQIEFTGNTSENINQRAWHFGSKGLYKIPPKEALQFTPNFFPVGEQVFITLYVPKDLSEIRTTRMYAKSWYKRQFRPSDIYPVIFHDF